MLGRGFQQDPIRAYYDEYDRKLLADYVFGNPRAECAIEFTLMWIGQDARKVLDIGRGIGWSSWEIKRHCPETSVISLDLSPRLTKVAQALFAARGVEYVFGDVTEYDQVVPSSIDAAVLLDVYEHIPIDRRSRLHSFLDKALTPSGLAILAFPSTRHQAFLREHSPNGLQPVDEDVTRIDVESLARDIHGHVVYFEEVSVGSRGDYVHAVISRVPGRRAKRKDRSIKLEDTALRRERVQSKLGALVLPRGVVAARRDGPGVCVATPSLGAYSETFIRAHIERLPADITVLYGGMPPTLMGNGITVAPPLTLARHLRSIVERRVRGVSWENWSRRPLVMALKHARVAAVLAEYGQMGVSMMDACEEAGIPLVVHFHGNDAYRSEVLVQYGPKYPELFRIAAAIVAVSRDMHGQLIRLGAAEDRLHLNPYGVDVAQFAGANPADAPPSFLGVGRFVDKKGPVFTLLAFQQLLRLESQARLVMIGEGPLLDVSRQLARLMGIAHAVDFRGAQPHEVVAMEMRNARAFVQHSLRPSDGDSEGTPVAVLEASASGLPVISTRHAGIPDVVVDGVTGILVDEGDVDGMTEAMLQLAMNPQLAADMGLAGRKRIAEHFTMEQSIANLWKILESAIGKTGNTHAPR